MVSPLPGCTWSYNLVVFKRIIANGLWFDLSKKREHKFLSFFMPNDISIQVSGSIGTISGSVGLKFDPFNPVGNQTPPATKFWLRFERYVRRRLLCQLLFGSG